MIQGQLTAFQPDIWQFYRTPLGVPGVWPWNWQGLSYPFWRIYWNEAPGAWITFRDADYALDPEYVVVVAPGTAIDHHVEAAVMHSYLHVSLGYPYDSVGPRIERIPVSELPMQFLDTALAGVDTSPGQRRLDFAHTAAAYTFVGAILCALPSDLWAPPPADPAIRKIVEEISRHPERAYPTACLAERCGISVRTLLRRFHEQVGHSPYQFVLERRLQKACLLLNQTNQSIERIADACGFSDRYHLSKKFKSRFGWGPAKYRRSQSPKGRG
ncbi:MAG: helix-turn-helix transcriptional regulator [Lentisphaerae bacterium]|jgi:AraC-like DNA-binding protein|nr:helix-turn-helix transcriptional regulator [Lentisphaerota bacterium]MBT4819210.1 helix-turn-helix transcriptional regulator [Lentisphaerota bacterium]MBT5609782.1 helix-turn-helix transcriptional regulator [Lentisphaerota bacterium]MBT7062094.1 helix-turn-helix transcriptional regulator [Lentisphaerota bacterium]MBT7847312.1 helix-turn-helix transcriptional regulator [Lentisphaerota bacterium]